MTHVFRFSYFVAISVMACFVVSLFVSDISFAQTLQEQITGQIDTVKVSAELGEARDPRLIAADFIRTILSLIGSVFFGLMVYGGYLILFDQGEEDRLNKGKKTIRFAVIGLIMIMMAYSLTTLVAKAVQASVQGELMQSGGVEYECEGSNLMRVFRGEGLCRSPQRGALQ